MTGGRHRLSDDPLEGNRWLFVVLSLLTLTLILAVVIASWTPPPRGTVPALVHRVGRTAAPGAGGPAEPNRAAPGARRGTAVA